MRYENENQNIMLILFRDHQWFFDTLLCYLVQAPDIQRLDTAMSNKVMREQWLIGLKTYQLNIILLIIPKEEYIMWKFCNWYMQIKNCETTHFSIAPVYVNDYLEIEATKKACDAVMSPAFYTKTKFERIQILHSDIDRLLCGRSKLEYFKWHYFFTDVSDSYFGSEIFKCLGNQCPNLKTLIYANCNNNKNKNENNNTKAAKYYTASEIVWEPRRTKKEDSYKRRVRKIDFEIIDFKAMYEFVNGCPSLEDLRLSYITFDKSYLKLMFAENYLRKITTLQFYHCFLSDDGLKSIGNIETLTYVSLVNVLNISEDGIQSLLNTNHNRIETLILISTIWYDKNNKSLYDVDIIEQGQIGVETLASVAMYCKQLKQFCIHGNGIHFEETEYDDFNHSLHTPEHQPNAFYCWSLFENNPDLHLFHVGGQETPNWISKCNISSLQLYYNHCNICPIGIQVRLLKKLKAEFEERPEMMGPDIIRGRPKRTPLENMEVCTWWIWVFEKFWGTPKDWCMHQLGHGHFSKGNWSYPGIDPDYDPDIPDGGPSHVEFLKVWQTESHRMEEEVDDSDSDTECVGKRIDYINRRRDDHYSSR